MPGQTHTPAPTTSTSTGVGNSTAGTSSNSTSGSNSAGLDRVAGGGLGAGATCDADQLNDLFDAISAAYVSILTERAVGVEELRRDAEVEDPPPAWQSIAIAVGTVALSAATAGIGTVVADALVGTAARAANAIVKAATDKGLSSAISAGLGAASGGSDEEVTEQFFRGQADALRASSFDVQQTFITQGRAAIRAGDDPCGAAQELLTAVSVGFPVAKQEQRQKTLSSWCNFQARGSLGTSGSGDAAGADLSDQLGDTSAKGVLGLDVSAPPGQRAVTIESAEIEGLNDTLRGELSRRPVGQLGLAVTVHGEVNPPAWWESRSADGVIRFGENEAGHRWRRNSSGGEQWLMWKGIGGPVLSGPDGYHPDDAERESNVWQGIANVLDNEIKPKTLSSLGVSLDG